MTLSEAKEYIIALEKTLADEKARNKSLTKLYREKVKENYSLEAKIKKLEEKTVKAEKRARNNEVWITNGNPAPFDNETNGWI